MDTIGGRIIVGNTARQNGGGLDFRNARATLPGVLQASGYRTIFVGKATLRPPR